MTIRLFSYMDFGIPGYPVINYLGLVNGMD